MLVARSTVASSRSLGIVIIVSTASASSSKPASACSRALAALELERLGDDGDGQRAHLVGEAGDDRRGAGAGAAAEAGRHEHHVGAAQHFENLVGVLERRRAADVRDRRRRRGPCVSCAPICTLTGAALFCSACWSVLATMNSTSPRPALHHPVDGVAAAAADADDLDAGAGADDVLVEENAELVGRGA